MYIACEGCKTVVHVSSPHGKVEVKDPNIPFLCFECWKKDRDTVEE